MPEKYLTCYLPNSITSYLRILSYLLFFPLLAPSSSPQHQFQVVTDVPDLHLLSLIHLKSSKEFSFTGNSTDYYNGLNSFIDNVAHSQKGLVLLFIFYRCSCLFFLLELFSLSLVIYSHATYKGVTDDMILLMIICRTAYLALCPLCYSG